MSKFLIVALMASWVLVSQAWAQLPEGFTSRFEIIRDDSGVAYIKDKSLVVDLSMEKFVEFLDKHVKSEQERWSKHNDHYYKKIESEILDDLEKLETNVEKNQGNKVPLREIYLHTLAKMENFDLREYTDNPEVKKVFEQYEKDMREAIESMNWSYVAALNDSTYYYKQTVFQGITLLALNLASSAVSETVAASVASYVITRFLEMLTEMKIYHQNILLYYLETLMPEQLGMTEDEHKRAISSVFEAQIDWFNFFESFKAQQDWAAYGRKKVEEYSTRSQKRQDKYKEQFKHFGTQLSLMFKEAIKSDEEHVRIMDFVHRKSFFSSAPSESYNFAEPEFHFRMRVFYEVFKLALSAVPVPGVSAILNPYINSRYIPTKNAEGALYGHFENLQDAPMLEQLMKQEVNPWEYIFKAK